MEIFGDGSYVPKSSLLKGDEDVSQNSLAAPSLRKRRVDRSASLSRASKITKRGYASPETYAHLNLLQDHLQIHLDGMHLGVIVATNLLTPTTQSCSVESSEGGKKFCEVLLTLC